MAVKADLRRLLREPDGAAFERTETGRLLVSYCGGVDEAKAWLDRAIASLKAPSERGRRAKRHARQMEILVRYDRGGESRPGLLRSMGISARLFSKERSAGLLRLATLIAQIELRLRSVHEVEQPFECRLRAIESYGLADEPELELSALAELEAETDVLSQRLRIAVRKVAALSRAGRIAAARHLSSGLRPTLRAAESQLRDELEPTLLLTLLRVRGLEQDFTGFARVMAELRKALAARAARGDQRATRDLAEAFLLQAMAHSVVCDVAGGEAALREAQLHLSRTLDVAPAMQVYALSVAGTLHALSPHNFVDAAREFVEVFRLARVHGLRRRAKHAVLQFADLALTAGEPALAAYYAEGYLAAPHRNTCEVTRMIAAVFVAAADHQLGRPMRSLQRLAESSSPASAGSVTALLAELVRASALVDLRRSREALHAVTAVIEHPAVRVGPYAADALVLRSRIRASEGQTFAARRDVDEALDLLEKRPAPAELFRACVQAHALTGRKRYRDHVLDIRRTAAGFRETVNGDVDLGFLTASGKPCDVPSSSKLSRLTERERAIATHVNAGHTNRRIATLLGISVRTVDQHVQSILTKLDLEARWQVPGPHVS